MYKDMLLGKNSQLRELVMSNDPEDKKKAEKLYKELNEQFHKEFPKELWDDIQESLKRNRNGN